MTTAIFIENPLTIRSINIVLIMKIINLYSELQLNPKSQATYRKLYEYYKSIGMLNEAEAYKDLISRKFNDNDPDIDEKQRKNDCNNS